MRPQLQAGEVLKPTSSRPDLEKALEHTKCIAKSVDSHTRVLILTYLQVHWSTCPL